MSSNICLLSILLLDIQMKLMSFAFIGACLARKRVLGALQINHFIPLAQDNGEMVLHAKLLS
jgi:hypothetical protein